MKWLKPSLVVLALVVCLAGSGYLIWMAGNRAVPSSREAFLLNLLLFILSSTLAGILGLVYAKISASERADTIAKSSTEKMVHLSLQLQRLVFFLRDTQSIAEQELTIDAPAALHAYRHRIESAATMAASLAASNEAFRNDWLGIASVGARRAIEEKYQDLREYLQDAETYEKLQEQSEAATGTDDQGKLAERLEKLEQKMMQATKKLPMQAIPFRAVSNVRAVATTQETTVTTPDTQTGRLRISVLRPVFLATGSGRLTPNMPSKPWVKARLVSCPEGLNPWSVICSAGAGTTFDFSVHLKSAVSNIPLPTGEYVCEYMATTADSGGAGMRATVTATCPQCGNSFPVQHSPEAEYAERPCHACGANLRVSPDGKTTIIPAMAAASDRQGASTSQDTAQVPTSDAIDGTDITMQQIPTRGQTAWPARPMTIACPNPNCRKAVPVKFRPDRVVEMKVCLSCNALLSIGQDGQAVVRGYYQAVDTTSSMVGGRPLLSCPRCGMNWTAITVLDGVAYAVCNAHKLVLKARPPRVGQLQSATDTRVESAAPPPDSTPPSPT